ncbi:TetR/AcrR family transcriptional regulator [Nonomuraea guangzhouensis]|uniref:TetR/AcrR family transcriptional regulator n=1 Tax=Nonomuraea guangzhouensis TaxID=1291555 RepID=UPI001FE7B2F8|nr:TetR/AcrR family transcriptional regulator C-terminal domain-containing protein [Nonomuraea guangzhouensis]
MAERDRTGGRASTTGRHPAEDDAQGNQAHGDPEDVRDETGEPLLVWERPEPTDRAAPVWLNRDLIVRAAIALADADGLAAVSLRKVAAKLDAGPMRLYRYMSTKEELLDLMVDAVYAEIHPPSPGGDWRAALRTLARRTRQAALRHEWFADLLGGRPHLGPYALAHLEASMAALHGVPGFEDAGTVRDAVGAVRAYLVGAIRMEIAERRVERASGLTEHQWQRATSPYLTRMFATGRYPTLAWVVGDATHPSAATAFDTGLDLLLDAIDPAGDAEGHQPGR